MESSFEGQGEKIEMENHNISTNVNLEEETSPRINPPEQIPHEDSDEDDRRRPLAIVRSPFGNMKVIREEYPHLSLGPDCTG
jgi:hypothetical protein